MRKFQRMQSRQSLLTVVTGLLFGFLLWGSSALAVPQKLGDTLASNDHPHNLSSAGISTIQAVETDQVCVFCHTPHNSSDRGSLWNRPDITGSFPLYGQLGDLAIDDIAEAKYGGFGNEYPNGATRLCLSCHDGVTAIGAVISSSDGPISLGPMTTMTIDLSTSHPVSFTYNDIGGIVLPAINAKTDPSITSGQYTLPTTPGILDAEGRMQCTACHDPHTDTNEDGYTLPMWRAYTNDLSENLDYETTCGECHVGGSGSSGLFNPMPLPLPVPIH